MRTWQDAFAGFGMRLAVFVRRFSKQGEKPGTRTKKPGGLGANKCCICRQTILYWYRYERPGAAFAQKNNRMREKAGRVTEETAQRETAAGCKPFRGKIGEGAPASAGGNAPRTAYVTRQSEE